METHRCSTCLSYAAWVGVNTCRSNSCGRNSLYDLLQARIFISGSSNTMIPSLVGPGWNLTSQIQEFRQPARICLLVRTALLGRKMPICFSYLCHTSHFYIDPAQLHELRAFTQVCLLGRNIAISISIAYFIFISVGKQSIDGQ